MAGPTRTPGDAPSAPTEATGRRTPTVRTPMSLAAFVPYRLAVVAEAVSRAVSQVYSGRFQLSRDEWRLLAALGEAGELRTRDALAVTTLDKVQASRAVARMEAGGLLVRTQDAADRRNHRLRLSGAGRSLYRRLVPLVRAREERLLDALPPKARAALDDALERLLARAHEMRDDDPAGDGRAG